MAGSTTKTVYDIFQSMEQGPAPASSTATAQAWLDHHSRALGLFIDGKFVCPADRQRRSLVDCKGGNVCTTVCAVEDDISQCASSAVNGFKAWSSQTCYQRAQVLLKLVSILGLHNKCVSELCELCEASCSPSTLVRLLQYYSSWAQLRDTLITNWKPLGVVAVVVSDDCSLYSLFLKVLPALAMGNSVIVVPGQYTAPPVLLLAQLFTGAGLPAGALNVLTGGDVSLGANVAQNPSISYVTYSGNKQDAVMLCKATAGMGIPISVSPCIGATCPFIIFDSADIDSAVDGAIEAAFRKKKEAHWVLCVQENVLDSVVSRLRLRMERMKCVGLRSDEDRVLVDAAVHEAQQQGATLIQSCSAPPSGAQYPPTVVCGTAPASPCVVSPAPGPLLPVLTFRSYTEAVTLGNHSPHGQAASIWTEDLTLAQETAKNLSVGSVWVNSHSVWDPCLPVAGHKDSGTCTDGGQEGMYQFLRPSSSLSPPLPRSSPLPMDYTKFGTGASPVIIPDDSVSAPKSYLQFVGGKTCKSVSGCSIPVQPPEGDGVLAYCPDGGRKDIRNAVEAAIKVQPGWMKKSPSARAQSLYSVAKGLEAKRRDVAASVHIQTGLSVVEAEKEVELSITRLSDWAAYCDKIQGGSLPMPQSGCALSVPEALGVIGVVLPDNNPLLSMVTLLGAAVATGNAVVMVPSQKYPLPALSFIQVLQASDLPAGLVNVISGSRDQLTVALANHSVIKAIWYWGSAEGCQYLQYTCTSPLKTLCLFCQKDKEGKDWTQSHPSLLENLWRNAVQWKSVWIPTA
ncbi:aldehyde dehydrogenase family 16 member A1 [Anabas testudineus]|uniref:aldehyde dehydrogenase family 16 member A1 n=1 Tax=Anabas testudineus TaxID=64144 RepID=UPI000E457DF9|nr:aldehyde dehydrogenase family 16 member A1 [Anabas testudineus]XP_026202741.1 aldehyde dehydrogenase family 16 member A1 [Anabas testudineus]XP_026202748.1 aldehyde dehydrogenase family 16 member A1 [Anabas testudineus]XP_026202756.1 aldehyde dehydrogenase family 16 member A1 [Anabas testudineus]XP_026202764.1 aldehyde dehydrogenase family 16 member A1 [Anabas testudineus]